MLKFSPVLISTAIIGIILYQSFLIAPMINKLLKINEASLLLRFVWPKFFLIIATLSLISILILFFLNLTQPKVSLFTTLSFIFMLICYFIIPTINEAKDSMNQPLWTILHLTTIGLTIITLILNFLSCIYWNLNE